MNFKKELKSNFTQADNAVLYDIELSALSKVVYLYLCSKPEDWDFAAYRIAEDIKETVSPVTRALKQLEDMEMLVREKQSNGKVVHVLKNHPSSKARHSNSLSGKSNVISNTVLKNNKKRKNKTKKTKKIPLHVSVIPEVWKKNKKFQKIWECFAKHRHESKSVWGESQAKMVINKMYTKHCLTVRGAIECLENAIEGGWKSVFPQNITSDPRNVDSSRSKVNRRKVRKNNASKKN